MNFFKKDSCFSKTGVLTFCCRSFSFFYSSLAFPKFTASTIILAPCIKTENAIIYPTENIVVVEGVPVSEMLNRSFYEVFENGDKKWLVTYADVALNGNKHILQDYSPEIDKTLTIYCFQPAPGYCACVLIPS